MPTVLAHDGLPLAVEVSEPPTGPAVASVVFLHGGAEHGGRYPRLIDALLSCGFEVTAPDLRGHGRSGGRKGDLRRFSDYLDDAEMICRAAAAPRFLIGYSLGGLIAAAYALEAPETLAGLVLAAPALGPGKDAPAIVFAVAKLLSTVAPRLPVFRMPVDSMMSDPSVLAAYRADPLVRHGWFTARLIAELTEMMQVVPERIGGLQVPLLVLHGEDDVTADPGRSRDLVQQAGVADKTLHLYPGTRHDLFNEPRADQVIADLTAWLTARLPAAEMRRTTESRTP
jgi:acylglycerol lipase